MKLKQGCIDQWYTNTYYMTKDVREYRKIYPDLLVVNGNAEIDMNNRDKANILVVERCITLNGQPPEYRLSRCFIQKIK